VSRPPAKKVLHVLGDKSWRPEYKFLGSTKDIVGRRDYFAARGIECVEMLVKGRHDYICLEQMRAMNLSGFDAVIMEHPRYPDTMRYLRATYPDLRLIIRGHNAELIHQVHTAWAYWKSGLSGWRWRLKRVRMSLKNALDRLSFDIACARLADHVLAIADWEARHYWPWITRRDKVLTAPYFLPEEYLIAAGPEAEKIKRCVCAMSADWSPLAHHAAKTMVDLVKAMPPERVKGWKFTIIGDLGKHRDAYKPLKSGGRVSVAGNLANPFEMTMKSRALAHLSNLGMGFKTKLLDFIYGGGWVLIPKTLYGRQPDEIRPFCIVVDPLTPKGFAKALKAAERPWPSSEGINERLRERAFAALDKALGFA
jgi:hypothetical protein